MSISYSAYIICGFKITIELLMKEQTKYNEDNGQQYQAMVRALDEDGYELDCMKIGDKIVAVEAEADDFCDGWEVLDIFESGYENGQKFLGKKLYEIEVYDEREDQYCDMGSDMPDCPDVVHEFALKHGAVAKLYLILSCG